MRSSSLINMTFQKKCANIYLRRSFSFLLIVKTKQKGKYITKLFGLVFLFAFFLFFSEGITESFFNLMLQPVVNETGSKTRCCQHKPLHRLQNPSSSFFSCISIKVSIHPVQHSSQNTCTISWNHISADDLPCLPHTTCFCV